MASHHFLKSGFGDDGAAEFLFERIAGHAAAVAFEQVDDQGDRDRSSTSVRSSSICSIFFARKSSAGDPLGLLERELEFHGLAGGFLEVDDHFFGREVPIDHLAGAEGFMNTEVSGSQL